MSSILAEVKAIDDDFNILKAVENGTYFIEERSYNKITQFDNEKHITAPEILKFVRYPHGLHVFLSINEGYFLRGMYPVRLRDYVLKKKIKRLSNSLFIKKEHLHLFTDFAEWWGKIRELRKNKLAYKKALKKFYGEPSDVTKECIANNYDCLNCPSCATCKIFKTDVSQRQFAQAVSMFYGGKPTNNQKLLTHIRALEATIAKCKKEHAQELKKTVEAHKKEVHKLEEVNKKLVDELDDFRRFKSNIKLQKFGFQVLDLISEGYSYAEIAKIIDKPYGSVVAIKRRILRQLRAIKRVFYNILEENK